jgi:ribonuclease R
VGEDFGAMILSATKYGLFVELDDLFVEGLVPIQSLGQLDSDYYTFRENTRQIIGEHWGRKFTFGQKVRVVLDRVDAVERRLQFSILAEDGMAEQPQRSTGKKSSPLRGKPAPAWSIQSAGKKKRQLKKSKRSMQQHGAKPKKFAGKKKRRK